MKILHTAEFYTPSVGGAQEVVRQISERLVERGHSVTVATTNLRHRTEAMINGVQIEEFRIDGNAALGMSGETARYSEFLLEGKFDLMLNYAAQQWTADLTFPLLHRLPFVKILVPCGFSGLYDPRYSGYFDRMASVLQQYDHIVFHANHYRDVDFARAHGIDHFTIIPNGASRAEFERKSLSFRQRYRIPDEIPLLLTVGSHTGLKGHKLVIEAFRLARLDRGVLLIIGNPVPGGGCLKSCRLRAQRATLASFGRKRVILLDLERPEVVAAFQAADLFVFGSSVEYSPLVLFEAMAARTPFLTVACGNAEEIIAWGQGGVLVPSWQGPDGRVEAEPAVLAREIERLLSDQDQRRHLAADGYSAWLNRFTWEQIAGEYERLYTRILSQHECR